MPTYADSLTSNQTWALAAYVRSLVRTHRRETAQLTGMMGMMMGGKDPQESLGMGIDMPGMPMMRGNGRE